MARAGSEAPALLNDGSPGEQTRDWGNNGKTTHTAQHEEVDEGAGTGVSDEGEDMRREGGAGF